MRAVAGWMVVVAVLALGALLIAPGLLGYERYVITGGSMEDAIPRGSVVFAERVPVSALRRGDVITFTPPAGAEQVTHRIARVHRRGDGRPSFTTKGDANRSVDPWRFELDAASQPRVAFHVPYLGYGLAALSIAWVRLLVIGLPALLVALAALAQLWRQAGDEVRAAREEVAA